MPDYVVNWKIDIEAGSPEEAAHKALEIQRRLNSIALVFDVTSADGETVEVDLLEDLLEEWRVYLHRQDGQLDYFQCRAVNSEHAKEQARLAHPGRTIRGALFLRTLTWGSLVSPRNDKANPTRSTNGEHHDQDQKSQ